jgi:uncharacterized protein YjiS (DUF1127 family)
METHMSQTLDRRGLSLFYADAPATPDLGSAIGIVMRTLSLWVARIKHRQTLYALDDRLLEDFGCSRREANREAAKPFWKA